MTKAAFHTTQLHGGRHDGRYVQVSLDGPTDLGPKMIRVLDRGYVGVYAIDDPRHRPVYSLVVEGYEHEPITYRAVLDLAANLQAASVVFFGPANHGEATGHAKKPDVVELQGGRYGGRTAEVLHEPNPPAKHLHVTDSAMYRGLFVMVGPGQYRLVCETDSSRHPDRYNELVIELMTPINAGTALVVADPAADQGSFPAPSAPAEVPGLTGPERALLHALKDAWNKYVALDKAGVPHWTLADDGDRFRRGINDLVTTVSARVALRTDPDMYA